MDNNKIPPREEMLTEKELAKLWGIGVSTLQHWRCATGGNLGPQFYKIGFRVFYHKDDIANYARARLFKSTSERVQAEGVDDGKQK
ncbi:MAG: helix-turn-helix domain-containing protein [Alphaproteobacteria bacterium]|nr:helix-turn-helix domain-containing protein [Alphaproteobacteria bacterium]